MDIFLADLHDPIIFVILLFLAVIVLAGIIIPWTQLRGIRSNSLMEARHLVRRFRWFAEILGGLIICDVVMVLLRSSVEFEYSSQALLFGFIFVNAFFANFIAAGFISVILAKKRMNELESP